MSTKTLVTAAAAATVLCVAQSALAHPGHAGAPGSGFSAGVMHPLTGIDHILAMLAVGLCAAQLGGRALWILPAAFLSCLLAGGILGLSGHAAPGIVEQGIAASLLVLGLMVAIGSRVGLPIVASLAGLFALFHGYAHGAEMTTGLAPAAYAGGFMLASTLLIAAGIGLGKAVARLGVPSVARLTGGGIALAGILFLCA